MPKVISQNQISKKCSQCGITLTRKEKSLCRVCKRFSF